MDKPLTNLATAPTALVAAAANGRRRRPKKGFSQLPGQARDVLLEVPQRLEGIPDTLERLLPRRRQRQRPHLAALLPHRKRAKGRPGTMKLARNLGAAASATVFAVDVISEVRRAAQARQRHSGGEGAPTSSSREQPAAAKKAGGAKSATPVKKASTRTSKAVSAKKAPAKKATGAKKATAAKKAPAKRVAATR